VAIDTFHRKIIESFAPDAETRMAGLCAGSAIRADSAATAMAYAQEVGYLRALSVVMERCKEIEAELYAPKSNEGKEGSA
jgi:hypothetical protein